MSYYKSPSIQIFESASPTYESVVAGDGVAIIGFSTMGPMNELMMFNSFEDFRKKMGDPSPNYPNSHILAQGVFNSGGNVYFVRAGKELLANKSSVFVTNHTGRKMAKYFWEAKAWNTDYTDKINSESLYLELKNTVGNTFNISFTPSINGVEQPSISQSFDVISDLTIKVEGGVEVSGRKGIHLDTIVKSFSNNPSFSAIATIKKSVMKDDGNYAYGLFVEMKNYSHSLVLDTTDMAVNNITSDAAGYSKINLGESSEGVEGDFTFKIEAKNPGSGINGFIVKKETITSPLSSISSSMSITISNSKGKVLETFTGLNETNFIERINNRDYGSFYVEFNDFSGDSAYFVDGSYVLGKGTLLEDGSLSYNDGDYTPEEGKDGIPTYETNPNNLTEEISDLFVSALAEPSLLNQDNVFFSVLAVPDSQNSLVQDAAINVARTRGDCMFIVDIPLEYSSDKSTVPLAVSWHNGGTNLRGSAIESSYAGVYYGWTTTVNPFTGQNINVPPSIMVVPKMISTEDYYAPAGATRGRVIASDYLYSPDFEDREIMCGGVNCINPIIYSNTRGLMIYGQKTADRTGSPLNRINVRRMVNRIKTKLYTSLDEVRFELNNANTQDRAKKISSDILFYYKSVGAIENYVVDSNSPGGAEKDVLNITIEFVPVGLIERIRVYLNITESGITATEA